MVQQVSGFPPSPGLGSTLLRGGCVCHLSSADTCGPHLVAAVSAGCLPPCGSPPAGLLGQTHEGTAAPHGGHARSRSRRRARAFPLLRVLANTCPFLFFL